MQNHFYSQLKTKSTSRLDHDQLTMPKKQDIYSEKNPIFFTTSRTSSRMVCRLNKRRSNLGPDQNSLHRSIFRWPRQIQTQNHSRKLCARQRRTNQKLLSQSQNCSRQRMATRPKWDTGRKRQPTEPKERQIHRIYLRIHSQRTQTKRTKEKSSWIPNRTPECYLGCLPIAYHVQRRHLHNQLWIST